MASNPKASKELKIGGITSSEAKIPALNQNQDDQDDFDKEIENYRKSKRDRNSVYIQRNLAATPKLAETYSVIGASNTDYLDFLKKKHLFIISKYEQILLLSSDMNKKMEENKKQIEELNNALVKLKEDKKKTQADIVNYLSNKESLEEVYKNKLKIFILEHKKENSKEETIKINFDLNQDSSKSKDQEEAQNFNIDQEEELDIKLDDIKKSDKDKYNEQVINFAQDLFGKKGEEEDFLEKLKSKVNIGYNIFFSETSSNTTNSDDYIITNFFSRISLFISNHSLGLYSESNISKFLRYLLKINSIDEEILVQMKFLNKKYKEQKIEMRKKIADLKEDIENLKEKKEMNDKKGEKYESIIQKNKQLIKEAKDEKAFDDNFEDNYHSKRKYTVHTINRNRIKKGELGDMNKSFEAEYEDLKYNLNDNKPKKSKFYKIREKEEDDNDDDKKKNISKDNPTNKKTEDKKIKSDTNLPNQNYIIIQNDININNTKEKNEKTKETNKDKKLSAPKQNTAKTDNTRNDRVQNIAQGRNMTNEQKNKEQKDKNYQPQQYNRNIYIINNINNSEQVQTKNNIYDNKSNSININSNVNNNAGMKANNRNIPANNSNNNNKNNNLGNKNNTQETKTSTYNNRSTYISNQTSDKNKTTAASTSQNNTNNYKINVNNKQSTTGRNNDNVNNAKYVKRNEK